MTRIQNTNPSGFNPRQVNRQNSPNQNPEVTPRGPSPPTNVQEMVQQGASAPQNLNRLQNEANVRQLNQDVIRAQERTGRLVAEDTGLAQIEDGLRDLQQQALNNGDNLVASPPRIAAALSEVINERNEISQELAASQDFIQQRLDQLSERGGQDAASVQTMDQAQQTMNEIRNQIQENPGGAMDSQANLTADNMQNLLG